MSLSYPKIRFVNLRYGSSFEAQDKAHLSGDKGPYLQISLAYPEIRTVIWLLGVQFCYLEKSPHYLKKCQAYFKITGK